MSDFDVYAGRRLSYAGALCTVRYRGSLTGTKGEWLGVEWDDPTRGKHGGQYGGEQVFKCLSSSSTAGSFIRLSRAPDPERTVLEAIRFKYGSDHKNGSRKAEPTDDKSKSRHVPVEISGKLVEEVGFERIQEQFAEFGQLRVVVLNDLVVDGIAPRGSSDIRVRRAKEHFSQTCPSITDLDVGWNPIETWSDVGHISDSLPQLRVLRASGLRLREPYTLPSGVLLSNLQELYLNECLLTWSQIFALLGSTAHSLFPALKLLALSNNQLCGLDGGGRSVLQFLGKMPSLETLILENNELEDLTVLSDLSAIFPNLLNVSLQGNKICRIGASGLASTHTPQTVQTLNLSSNMIASWLFLDNLPRAFPELSSLRISRNSVYDEFKDSHQSSSKTASDSSYFLTVARIPSLKSLNYSTISTQDRQEGEIYYLSVAEKTLAEALNDPTQSAREQARDKYYLYESLCEKYDRQSIFARQAASTAACDTPAQQKAYAPGTLGSRLLSVEFHLASESQSYHRLIPATINVYSLKALVARHFDLPPLQFRLIYESAEFDPVREAISSTNWDEWGDWDADELRDVEGGTEVERWVDGVMLKDGKRWQRREVEILNGMRPWADVLEMDVTKASIRVEPFQWKALSK